MEFNYLDIVVPVCTAIGTIISIAGILGSKFSKIEKQFEKIHEELKEIRTDIRQQGERISRIEGYLSGRDANPHKTGTDHG